MNDLFKKVLGMNWKTTLSGLASLLLTVPQFVSAITAWANHQAVDWRPVLISVAMAVLGTGLVAAKDGTTHSTIAQVEKATTGQDPQGQQTSTVQVIEPLPQGGMAVTSQSTTVTKPEVKP